jgi:hypothetical protein
MTYIEGDADHGFTITIDGPTSLFKPSTRYGLAIAKLLPPYCTSQNGVLRQPYKVVTLIAVLEKLDVSASMTVVA